MAGDVDRGYGITSPREQWIARRVCELLRGAPGGVYGEGWRQAHRQARAEAEEIFSREEAA